ncbi:class I SAM-dependent methyltransferase [Gracilimonas tropica]|uniref:class I SAM-dependent methyltransferase n=1 Tax=Gracilimonas tropica TaxID=454600 RepID=UPI000377E6F6|nr:class I SAM-dependent methyltransferase [Gracilimonas tropica]
MKNKDTLNLDGPWALGEEVFEVVIDELKEKEVKRFVEFGSGSSSVRLSQAFENADIYSVEHDEEYAGKTRELKENYLATDNLKIIHAPLQWQKLDGRLYKSYSKVELPDDLDAVLIDGPPYWTRRGREFCMYQVYDKVRKGGKFFLDDASRLDEMKIVKNWLSLYPNSFECKRYKTKKGLLVLTKKEHVRRKSMSTTSLIDNWSTNLRHLVSNLIK